MADLYFIEMSMVGWEDEAMPYINRRDGSVIITYRSAALFLTDEYLPAHFFTREEAQAFYDELLDAEGPDLQNKIESYKIVKISVDEEEAENSVKDKRMLN